jgi:uncharacterized delta-60 repeat protein
VLHYIQIQNGILEKETEIPNFSANSIGIQNDGKIVIVGYKLTNNNDSAYNALARYNTDGSLDVTFSGDGIQSIDFEGTSVTFDNNGKIIVTGSDLITRYNTNGSPDNTFRGDR